MAKHKNQRENVFFNKNVFDLNQKHFKGFQAFSLLKNTKETGGDTQNNLIKSLKFFFCFSRFAQALDFRSSFPWREPRVGCFMKGAVYWFFHFIEWFKTDALRRSHWQIFCLCFCVKATEHEYIFFEIFSKFKYFGDMLHEK